MSTAANNVYYFFQRTVSVKRNVMTHKLAVKKYKIVARFFLKIDKQVGWIILFFVGPKCNSVINWGLHEAW